VPRGSRTPTPCSPKDPAPPQRPASRLQRAAGPPPASTTQLSWGPPPHVSSTCCSRLAAPRRARRPRRRRVAPPRARVRARPRSASAGRLFVRRALKGRLPCRSALSGSANQTRLSVADESVSSAVDPVCFSRVAGVRPPSRTPVRWRPHAPTTAPWPRRVHRGGQPPPMPPPHRDLVSPAAAFPRGGAAPKPRSAETHSLRRPTQRESHSSRRARSSPRLAPRGPAPAHPQPTRSSQRGGRTARATGRPQGALSHARAAPLLPRATRPSFSPCSRQPRAALRRACFRRAALFPCRPRRKPCTFCVTVQAVSFPRAAAACLNGARPRPWSCPSPHRGRARLHNPCGGPQSPQRAAPRPPRTLLAGATNPPRCPRRQAYPGGRLANSPRASPDPSLRARGGTRHGHQRRDARSPPLRRGVLLGGDELEAKAPARVRAAPRFVCAPRRLRLVAARAPPRPRRAPHIPPPCWLAALFGNGFRFCRDRVVSKPSVMFAHPLRHHTAASAARRTAWRLLRSALRARGRDGGRGAQRAGVPALNKPKGRPGAAAATPDLAATHRSPQQPPCPALTMPLASGDRRGV
jgi:hypothetical protein